MGRAISCCRYEPKKEITLLMIGLDNAGKTSTVRQLQKEEADDVVPTVGFSNISLKDRNNFVKVFDLGGGTKIRDIWKNYYASSFGIIFVVDSADRDRLEECQTILEVVIQDYRISGKPILMLINKQDKPEALDETEICQILKLEYLVNKYKCPTRVETTSTIKKKANSYDQGIMQGYKWLLSHIDYHFKDLNARVQLDSNKQKEQEMKALEEKMARIKKLREEREEMNGGQTEIEDNDIGLSDNPFKPISSYISKEEKQDNISSNKVNKFLKNKIGPMPDGQDQWASPKSIGLTSVSDGDK